MFKRLKKWWNTRTRYYLDSDGTWTIERWYFMEGWDTLTDGLTEFEAEEIAAWWHRFDQEYLEKKRSTPTYRYP